MFSNMYVHIINTLVFLSFNYRRIKIFIQKKNIVKTLVKINLYIHNYIKIVPLSFFLRNYINSPTSPFVMASLLEKRHL